MSDFHLRADLPPEASDAEVTQIRADAIKTALTHAATDPAIHIRMLVGRAYSEQYAAIAELASKIQRAGAEVEATARLFVEEPELISRFVRDDEVAAAHHALLTKALARLDQKRIEGPKS